MRTLICPISTEQVDNHVVRTTALITATILGLFAITGNILFMLVVAIDFVIRIF